MDRAIPTQFFGTLPPRFCVSYLLLLVWLLCVVFVIACLAFLLALFDATALGSGAIGPHFSAVHAFARPCVVVILSFPWSAVLALCLFNLGKCTPSVGWTVCSSSFLARNCYFARLAKERTQLAFTEHGPTLIWSAKSIHLCWPFANTFDSIPCIS